MLTPILNRFVYRPDATGAPSDFTPSDLGLKFEELSLRTEDGLTLAGWYVPAPNPKHSLLYLHGNGGDIRDWIGAAPPFVARGINVFLIDYRGYGRSEGRPTEQGLYLDGEAGWRWLKTRADTERLPASILGKSLGSGVATYLAAEDSPASLILDSAFTSMREVALLHAPWLPERLVPKMFESLERAAKITCPTLVIHGDRDDLIPLAQGLRLCERLQAPKVLRIVEGAGHNDIDSFESYQRWVADFLGERALTPGPSPIEEEGGTPTPGPLP